MSFVKRAWDSRPTLSVELENKGSVARDHLADERTFLAWLRTSLALVSLGVAIAQLFKLPEIIEPKEQGQGNAVDSRLTQWLFGSAPDDVAGESAFSDQQLSMLSAAAAGSRLDSLERLGKPLGSTCIALGGLCLLLGSYRYFAVQKQLIQGQFPPSRVEISVMALLVGALIVAAFGIIVGVSLHPKH